MHWTILEQNYDSKIETEKLFFLFKSTSLRIKLNNPQAKFTKIKTLLYVE